MTLTQKFAMTMWLRSFPWTWFATLTFRQNLSSETCHRIFLDWIAQLERYEGKPIYWARMVEKGRQTHRLHIHAVIAGPLCMSTQKAAELWRGLAGNATISGYDPERRGVQYMLKTMEDNPDNDFDLFLPKSNPRLGHQKIAKSRQESGDNGNEANNDGGVFGDFVPKSRVRQAQEALPMLSNMHGASSSIEFEPLLSAIEAAPLVNLHPGTLLRWAREARVPHHRMSRKVFFRASELDAWCAGGFKMTTTVRAAQL